MFGNFEQMKFQSKEQIRCFSKQNPSANKNVSNETLMKK